MNSPHPRAALVTGAAHRIGRAIALGLAADGWAVGIHCRNSEATASDTVAEIRSQGGTAECLVADLADRAEVSDLMPRATNALGPISCLINNASIFEEDKIDTATPESFDQHIAVNLRAPLFLSQAFAAQIPAGALGNIINILDQRVWNLTPYFTSYTLSKVGLWSLTQTTAMALAPDIRVNAIGPGPTLPSPRQTDTQFRQQYENLPLPHPVELSDITAAVRFILATPSMTGQMIALDSGQHLGWAHAKSDRGLEE
jgi:NAD(P)-dependent dehydrogenase (short-subunit alcohol dehydrogenase family)